MRYKEHTISKLDAQTAKLETVKRSLQMHAISAADTVSMIESIIKEIKLVIDRLQLEYSE